MLYYLLDKYNVIYNVKKRVAMIIGYYITAKRNDEFGDLIFVQ